MPGGGLCGGCSRGGPALRCSRARCCCCFTSSSKRLLLLGGQHAAEFLYGPLELLPPARLHRLHELLHPFLAFLEDLVNRFALLGCQVQLPLHAPQELDAHYARRKRAAPGGRHSRHAAGDDHGHARPCRTNNPPVTTPVPKITIVARMTFQVFTRRNRWVDPDPLRPAGSAQVAGTNRSPARWRWGAKNDHAPSSSMIATHGAAARHKARPHSAQSSRPGPGGEARHDAFLKGIRHPLARRVGAGGGDQFLFQLS